MVPAHSCGGKFGEVTWSSQRCCCSSDQIHRYCGSHRVPSSLRIPCSLPSRRHRRGAGLPPSGAFLGRADGHPSASWNRRAAGSPIERRAARSILRRECRRELYAPQGAGLSCCNRKKVRVRLPARRPTVRPKTVAWSGASIKFARVGWGTAPLQLGLEVVDQRAHFCINLLFHLKSLFGVYSRIVSRLWRARPSETMVNELPSPRLSSNARTHLRFCSYMLRFGFSSIGLPTRRLLSPRSRRALAHE